MQQQALFTIIGLGHLSETPAIMVCHLNLGAFLHSQELLSIHTSKAAHAGLVEADGTYSYKDPVPPRLPHPSIIYT